MEVQFQLCTVWLSRLPDASTLSGLSGRLSQWENYFTLSPGRSGKVERGEGRTQSAARLPLVLPRDKKQSESDRETNNVLQHLKVRSIEVRNFWESTFLNSPRPACF